MNLWILDLFLIFSLIVKRQTKIVLFEKNVQVLMDFN